MVGQLRGKGGLGQCKTTMREMKACRQRERACTSYTHGRKRSLRDKQEREEGQGRSFMPIQLVITRKGLTNETTKGAQDQMKEVPAAKYPICFKILISFFRIPPTRFWKLGSQA
jgi:hypothetical protein